MGNAKVSEFVPDYAIPPGETLQETIQFLGMSQAELAKRAGISRTTISDVVNGRAAITPRMALQFERVLGAPATFWNNLERNYQQTLVRQAEKKKLKSQTEWMLKIPVAAMAKVGWIRRSTDEVEQLQEVLDFFGVASPQAWERVWTAPQAAFRKSRAFESEPGSVAAWLRKGEIESQQMECRPYNESRFEDSLRDIRALTTEPPNVFQAETQKLCAAAGVAVVFVPELPKTRLSGATRWLTPNKAIIELSVRHKSDDHLWFTFFHEAGHILRHGKTDVFIDEDWKRATSNSKNKREREANEFASSLLVPAEALGRFVAENKPKFSAANVRRFASELGIAPGIVVGRLQYEGHIPYSHLNALKQRFKWAESGSKP